MLLAGIIFLSAGAVFASEDAKPWESMTRFRGGDELSAKDWGMPQEVFHAHRDETREEHRAARMEARKERLMAAVESGCITLEEIEERMQTRRGRFAGK